MARVLVADDDADLRATLRRALVMLGHEVYDCDNGSMALDLLETKSFDLVIADVYMGAVDGVELVARLQQRGLRVPIVIMSGGGFRAREDVLKTAEALGAVATLEKPFTLEQLRRTLQPFLPVRRPGSDDRGDG